MTGGYILQSAVGHLSDGPENYADRLDKLDNSPEAWTSNLVSPHYEPGDCSCHAATDNGS